MIYEGTIQYVKIDKNGNDKKVKESYVIDNAESFEGTENKLYEEFGTLTDIDVVALKRSKLKEIANLRKNDDETLWEATLRDIFTNDDGEETPINYKILLHAKGWDNAMRFVTEYAKQGYNMELVSLKETKFKAVLW